MDTFGWPRKKTLGKKYIFFLPGRCKNVAYARLQSVVKLLWLRPWVLQPWQTFVTLVAQIGKCQKGCFFMQSIWRNRKRAWDENFDTLFACFLLLSWILFLSFSVCPQFTLGLTVQKLFTNCKWNSTGGRFTPVLFHLHRVYSTFSTGVSMEYLQFSTIISDLIASENEGYFANIDPIGPVCSCFLVCFSSFGRDRPKLGTHFLHFCVWHTHTHTHTVRQTTS